MFSASDVYGGWPSPQPNASGVPDHAPGQPEPSVRTVPRQRFGLLADPVLLLVVLLAVAVLLINFTLRVEVSG